MKNSLTLDEIAVIIITHNGAQWIEKCLQSVLDSSVAVQVFIVDNASSDATIATIQKFQNINLEILDENIGFGKANNIAIIKAITLGYKNFFLLNQDTWIEKDTIKKLVLQQNKNVDFGILSPLHFDNGMNNLDANFATYYSLKKGYAENLLEVPFVNAAAWLVSLKCFAGVGFFEPIFNHYGEDRNFCNRVHFHKFKIGIVDDARIVHDRIIIRKFQKDLQQSKYAILNTLININVSRSQALCSAFMQVFGLPKFFYKFYGFQKSVVMLYNLLCYFLINIANWTEINVIRKKSIDGKIEI